MTILPSMGDNCIFCGQKLGYEQIELIKMYFKHIEQTIIKEREELESKIDEYKIKDFLLTLSEDDEVLFNENLIVKIKAVINFVNTNKEVYMQNISSRTRIKQSLSLNFAELTKEIREEINFLSSRLLNLKKSNEEMSSIIGELKQNREILLKNMKLHELIISFRNWHIYDETIKELGKIKNGFNSASLTRKSKEAFDEIVKSNYEQTLKNYCDRLKVTSMNIKFTPHKGQTLRSKYVVNEGLKVTDIMSEGEQKGIALAEFITDLVIRDNYNTVFFDDPVTSLDYKRAQIIADIIYEISKERQVIVFTHNIMFYYYLYNCCQKDKDSENKFFKVDEYDKKNKGIVTESFSGRLETLKEITGKIKSHKQIIDSPKCMGDELEEQLKKAYSDIRTWCELIVEEGFFKKVIRRYEPNIMFTLVTKIDGSFVGELPLVSSLFDKSCRYMLGHSQPFETQNSRASREEFNSDYIYIITTYDKYKG